MKKFIVHIALIIISAQAFGQILPNFGGQRAGLSTLSFLKNDMNPRSVAMGGASVALPGDIMSVYTNPASVAEVKDLSFGVSNYFVGAGANQGLVTAIIPTKSASSFGITVNTLNSGAMEVRTEFQPMGTGQKTYANNLAAGLTYSKILSDQFSFGVTMKYIYEQLAEYYNHTAAVDVGFKYNTDFKDLSFAVMMQNFSGSSSLSGDEREVDFNRSGMSLDNYTVPNVFKLGVSMKPVEVGNHALLTTFELNHPNDNAENYRIGAEYQYLDLLQVRAGYKFNVLGQRFPTFGIGIHHSIGAHPMQINYAVNPTNYLGVQHAVSFGLSINKMERN
jgi:hypothetical protein